MAFLVNRDTMPLVAVVVAYSLEYFIYSYTIQLNLRYCFPHYIIVTGADLADIKAKINDLLIKLQEWVNLNSLKLNVKKHLI